MKPTKEEFFRDINNYVHIINDVYRRDYNDPTKLNPNTINKTVFTSKFDFTNQDYASLPEYDGFINDPAHLDYSPISGGKWNTYAKVSWKPVPGPWPTIEKLINHLYGKNEVEEDQREELYDYHTVMVKYPKHKQQGRVLYSHMQKTAKSALAELESMILQGNYAKIRDSEFESTFNSIWVSALLLHFDEPMFEKPLKTSRVIRDLITSNTQNIRKMKTDYATVDFYAKLLITTNDSNFMPFQKDDRRYWIREVPRFKAEDKDNNFIEKMKKEVNHYIYFLLNREMKYPESVDETFWLPQSIIETNGFKKLVEDNKSNVEKAVVDVIEDWFLVQRNVEKTEVAFRLSDIKSNVAAKLKISESKIKDLELVVVLRDSLHMDQPKTSTRVKKNIGLLSDVEMDRVPGRWWLAERCNFDCSIDLFNVEM